MVNFLGLYDAWSSFLDFSPSIHRPVARSTGRDQPASNFPSRARLRAYSYYLNRIRRTGGFVCSLHALRHKASADLSKTIDFAHRSDFAARSGSRDSRATRCQNSSLLRRLASFKTSKKRFQKSSSLVWKISFASFFLDFGGARLFQFLEIFCFRWSNF